MYAFTSRYPSIVSLCFFSIDILTQKTEISPTTLSFPINLFQYGDGVDPILKGLVTSILELGAFVGALIAGPIADRISRKYSISCWCLVFMLGTSLQVGATTNIDFIWAGRFIAGLAVGALSFLVPLCE